VDGVWGGVVAVVNAGRNGQAAADSLTDVSDESPRITDRISKSDVSKVATLARLILTDDELATATAELGAMLDHFADIDALDLDDVEPMMQPTPLANVMREDIVGVTLDRDEVLGQAPLAEDGRFRVPPIVGIEE
jgi:aspartyl-tRNA(Asn)/glutamyl-tRNA(Gln) amidotransferase subunit C